MFCAKNFKQDKPEHLITPIGFHAAEAGEYNHARALKQTEGYLWSSEQSSPRLDLTEPTSCTEIESRGLGVGVGVGDGAAVGVSSLK
ncbi:hypothetical protein N7478_000562 [Penicillium angulare]|uniref:uncharacterized protein n=1 Tax=Penicillium angulare TaxID=116970 RepID=UPI002540B8B6|nr:uncharacterized protein N7478_000562 [Penicillium angulare]KAJ5291311.1 hypothetical protein N7478_000562 [Penicillium angulare]